MQYYAAFLSEPFEHCGGFVSCSADADGMNADVDPAGMYLGLVSPVPMASPVRAQNANTVLAVQTGHGSVLACKGRICFFCLSRLKSCGGKAGQLAPVAGGEEMVQVRKGCF